MKHSFNLIGSVAQNAMWRSPNLSNTRKTITITKTIFTNKMKNNGPSILHTWEAKKSAQDFSWQYMCGYPKLIFNASGK